MPRVYLKILVATLFWLAGALASATLLLEYPPSVSSVLWRTYPGLFQWPVVFFPFCCFFLLKPLELTWHFLSAREARARPLRMMFAGLIALGLFGLSAYEWFNDKPAVWELSPEVTSRPAAAVVPVDRQSQPFVMSVTSFNDLALSIRAQAPAADVIPACRFSGTNLPLYRGSQCFCAPVRRVISGAQCDTVREIWFNALATEIAKTHQRSYSYYTTRLSFSIMALIFMTGLITVIYMSCFAGEMERDDPETFKLSRIFIQIFAILAAVWFIQRVYLIYEQATIFPSGERAVFTSSAYSIFAGLLIALGFIYAFSLKINAVKAFIENLLVPIFVIGSTALGIAQPELVVGLFRSTFGVDATGPALIGFVAFVTFIALIPMIYWLKGSNLPLKRRRGGRTRRG